MANHNYLSTASYMSPRALILPKNLLPWFTCCYWVTPRLWGQTGTYTFKQKTTWQTAGIKWNIHPVRNSSPPSHNTSRFNLQRCLIQNGWSMSMRNFSACKFLCAGNVRSVHVVIRRITLSGWRIFPRDGQSLCVGTWVRPARKKPGSWNQQVWWY